VERVIKKLLEFADNGNFGRLLEDWTAVAARLEGGGPKRRANADTLDYLRLSLLRLCVVRVAQDGGRDAVSALYNSYASALAANASEWEQWMALQYTEKPEQHPQLGCFFTGAWRSVLEETLRSGLQGVVQELRLPVLLDHGPFVQVRKRLDAQAREYEAQLHGLEGELEASQLEVSATQSRLAERFQVHIDGPGTNGEGSLHPGPEGEETNPGTTEAEPYFEVRRDIFPSDSESAPRLTSGVCRYSLEGDYMASGGSDGFLYLWSPDMTQPIGLDCGTEVLSFAWKDHSRSERLLLFSLGNGDIRLFDAVHHRTLQEMSCDAKHPGTNTRVTCLAFRPSTATFVAAGHASGTLDGVLLSYDLRSGHEEMMFELMPAPRYVTTMAFNQNGRLMVSGSHDGTMRVFDMSSCQPIMQWNAHDGAVSSVFFSNDETAILSAGIDGRILRWSLHHLSRTICGTSMPGHDGKSPIRLCPNGEGDHFVASSPAHRSALLYKAEARGHRVVQTLFDHTTPMLDMDWHPTLNVVASLAEDGTFSATKLLRRGAGASLRA